MLACAGQLTGPDFLKGPAQAAIPKGLSPSPCKILKIIKCLGPVWMRSSTLVSSTGGRGGGEGEGREMSLGIDMVPFPVGNEGSGSLSQAGAPKQCQQRERGLLLRQGLSCWYLKQYSL